MGIDKLGTVYFNGLTPFPDQSATGTPWVMSTRDGRRFTDITPTTGPAATHVDTLDPYLYVDPRTGRVFSDDLVLPCSLLSTTDRAAEGTWTSTLVGCTQADHQTVFAGPAPSGGAVPTGYPDVVYYCSISGGALSAYSTASVCSKSLDGGTTFLPTARPAFLFDPTVCLNMMVACDGTTGHGYVGPDGTIYLPKNYNGQPHVAISHDEGDSWTVVQVAGTGVNTNDEGYADHEAAVVTDAAGHVYFSWIARNRLPYLAVSRDGGRSWGKPMEVGPPGLRQADLPALDSLANGTVALQYLGSTNAPAAPFPDDSNCPLTDPLESPALGMTCPGADAPYEHATWNDYVTVSRDALAADPVFFSGPVNDPADPVVIGHCGPVGRCQQVFDFQDVQISPYDGSVWTVYVDACARDDRCQVWGEAVLGRLDGIDLRRPAPGHGHAS